MQKEDPYSRESIVAAINLIGGTPAEKHALLEKMTADVERLAAEARSANSIGGEQR